MAKKKLLFISVPVFTLFVVVVLRMILFSSVFSGERSHDFGFVEVTPPDTILTHTFTLTNQSSRDLLLVDVVPDCGCTTTGAYQDWVLQGEDLVLPVQLKLRQSQLRRSTIRLVFDDGTVEVLRLSAHGQIKDPLRISTYPIVVKKDGVASLATIGMEQFDNIKPPVPTFTCPNEVMIHTQQWTQTSKYNARQKIPAKWSMQLSFTTDKELGVGKELVIAVGDYMLRVPFVSKAKPPIELPYTEFPLH
jgi:hypothetical protein